MSVTLRLTYDAGANAAYLYLREGRHPVGPTLLLERDPEFPGWVAMDFSRANGMVIGFEFHFARECLPAELLAQAERIDRP